MSHNKTAQPSRQDTASIREASSCDDSSTGTATPSVFWGDGSTSFDASFLIDDEGDVRDALLPDTSFLGLGAECPLLQQAGRCDMGDVCPFQHTYGLIDLNAQMSFGAGEVALGSPGQAADFQQGSLVGPSEVNHGVDVELQLDLPCETQYMDPRPAPSTLASTRIQTNSPAVNTRARFSPQTKALLEEAFALEPYPDAAEILSIARNVQLEPKQVKTWFGNKRSRTDPTTLEPRASGCKTASSRASLTRKSLEELQESIAETKASVASTVPFGIDHEAGGPVLLPQLPSILGRIKSSTSLPSDYLHATDDVRARDDATSDESVESSDISLSDSDEDSDDDALSENVSLTFSNAGSYASGMSSSSVLSSTSRASRRGRRQWQSRHQPYARPSAFNASTFFCTFCGQSFLTSYAWRRHEESVHVQLKRWLCQDCNPVDKEEAIFYRKDNLLQHLSLVHDKTTRGTDTRWADDWMLLSEADVSQRSCHHCNKTFATWSERVDHFESHFRNSDAICRCQFVGCESLVWPFREYHMLHEHVEMMHGGIEDSP